MLVTLVSTWGIPCGIAEAGWYMKQAVEAVDSSLSVIVESDLHPSAVLDKPFLEVVWLNFHAALLSQWHAEHIQTLQGRGVRVVCTYHDTGVPNSDQCKALHAVADVFVVHEPAEDLPGAIYLRQGVPDWAHQGIFDRSLDSWCGRRPVVGTVGFPLPWKNYDLLAEASARAGWALLLLAPGATPEQVARWSGLNPHSDIRIAFTHRDEVLRLLSGCDATAFLYANMNTGTSAAIRQGIAARKPVLATNYAGCRQFVDLYYDGLGNRAIRWLSQLDVESVAEALEGTAPMAFDPTVVRLAARDSWTHAGQVYARLLRGDPR
jgi:glycosyltransferase involved in cell wall biosynthesis